MYFPTNTGVEHPASMPKPWLHKIEGHWHVIWRYNHHPGLAFTSLGEAVAYVHRIRRRLTCP